MKERRRNPFGVGASDVVKWGAIGISALIVLSALGDLGKHIPGATPSPAPVPGGDAEGTDQSGQPVISPTSNIALTDFSTAEGLLRAGGTITGRWTVNHLGAQGRYVVGLQIAPTHALALIGQHNSPVLTLEDDAPMTDDATWYQYRYEAAARLSVSAGSYDLRAYVRDSSGKTITEMWINYVIVL